jgi:hypothetical protein
MVACHVCRQVALICGHRPPGDDFSGVKGRFAQEDFFFLNKCSVPVSYIMTIDCPG